MQLEGIGTVSEAVSSAPAVMKYIEIRSRPKTSMIEQTPDLKKRKDVTIESFLLRARTPPNFVKPLLQSR